MNYAEKLDELIKKQHGTVLSADLDAYEIPRVYLQMMVAEGKLERVDRGVYVSTDSIEEDICCKGWMSNPLLKQRRLAHSQRFEPATQRGRDRQAAWSERYVHPYISSSKIELAAALTRKDVSPLPPTTPVGGARTA